MDRRQTPSELSPGARRRPWIRRPITSRSFGPSGLRSARVSGHPKGRRRRPASDRRGPPDSTAGPYSVRRGSPDPVAGLTAGLPVGSDRTDRGDLARARASRGRPSVGRTAATLRVPGDPRRTGRARSPFGAGSSEIRKVAAGRGQLVASGPPGRRMAATRASCRGPMAGSLRRGRIGSAGGQRAGRGVLAPATRSAADPGRSDGRRDSEHGTLLAEDVARARSR